jgi:hypothetical protein
MIWSLVLLVFVGTNALFGGMFLGFYAFGWQRKPPLRAIALAGLVLAALSMAFLNGMPAVPSAAVCLFCTGLLFLSPANENLWFDTCTCEARVSQRVIEYMRLFAFGGLILAIAAVVFIDGFAAVLAAAVSYVCGVVLALRLADK